MFFKLLCIEDDCCWEGMMLELLMGVTDIVVPVVEGVLIQVIGRWAGN
ncbi:MAG: hypothetical protein ACLP01_07385 [Solirubrobacteraceae bacterium]